MPTESPKAPATSPRRILFVDDEPNILAGLRNALRSERQQWDMDFAVGAREALTKIAEKTFDVVVTDMRMPYMDGATLLGEIRRLQPKAVRIILTGQTERESVMKSVFVAHVFLFKPCEVTLLKRVIERASSLSSLLDSESLRETAGRVDMLPAVPRTYLALNEALTKPNYSVADVAQIIEQDVGLCAKILQMVNAAFFGLPRRITSVGETVAYLGTITIKNLAIALEAFSSAAGSCGLSNEALVALQAHSLLVGQIAKRLCSKDKSQAEEAFLAGVLHEVGWLVRVDPQYEKGDGPPVDRALLGAYLLALWGLSHPITEAVAYHRTPQLIEHTSFELVDMVYVAHHLVGEQTSRKDAELDVEYLSGLGVGETDLEHMRAIARGLLGPTKEPSLP